MSVVRVSGGPLAPTQLMKDPEQEAFMVMWQNTTQFQGKTEGRNPERQPRMDEDKFNEADTLDKEDNDFQNFRFDLHKVPEKSSKNEEKKGSSIIQHRSNTEQLKHEESNYRSTASNKVRMGGEAEEQMSETKVVSPSYREEVKTMQ